MNWLSRVAQQVEIKEQLTINTLTGFVSTDINSDISGQQYLWKDDFWDKIRNYRTPSKNPFYLILKHFHSIFSCFESMSTDKEKDWRRGEEFYNIFPSIDFEDEDYIENEIREYAESYTSDMDFSEYDWDSLIEYLEKHNHLDKVYKHYFENEGLPSQQEFLTMYRDILKYVHLWEDNDVPHSTVPEEIESAYDAAVLDESKVELFYEKIKEVSDEIRAIVEDNEKLMSWRQKKVVPDDIQLESGLITRKKLQEAIQESLDDEIVDWYIYENRHTLEQSASESIYEYARESVKDSVREMERSLGFNPFNVLCEDYDPYDSSDERKDISLDLITDIVEELKSIEHYCPDVRTCINEVNMYLFAIQNIIEIFNLNLQDIFDTGVIESDLERAFEALADNAKSNPDSIPDEFNDPEIKKIIEYLKLHGKQKTLDSLQMANIKEELDERVLQRMKELGLAENPFPHIYSVKNEKFNDSDNLFSPKILKPFRIDVSWGSSLKKIPEKLMKIINPNAPEVGGNLAFGSIGGLADYANNIVYVTSVYSPLMEKVDFMISAEEYLNNVNLKVEEEKNKLLAIENSGLPQEQIEKEKRTIENNIYRYEFNAKNPKYKELSKWSQYREYISNTFKDWIAVFFNAAIREATMSSFDRLRIIDSSNFEHGDKEAFKNIYDNTAMRYQAKPVVAFQKKFWEIDLSNVKYAKGDNMNWLKKAMYKESQEAQWTRDTGPLGQQYIISNGVPLWQSHISNYFRSFRNHPDGRNVPNQIIFEYWLSQVPENLKRDGGLISPFKEDVKQYVIQNLGFNPFSQDELDVSDWGSVNRRTGEINHTIHPRRGKKVWEIHLDIFWQEHLEEMPELSGPEFDTGDEGYQREEGNKLIFNKWMTKVPSMFKVNDDELIPEFKKEVRNYLIRTKNFDPFADEDGDEGDGGHGDVDPSAPSIEDLNNMFSTETYHGPSGSLTSDDDIEVPSAESLEEMFSEAPREPRRPNRNNPNRHWWEEQ